MKVMSYSSRASTNFQLTLPIVYNFWEPLHFLHRGYGFQTWEVAPQYGIRSWAYILFHLLPARFASLLLGPNKVSNIPGFIRFELIVHNTIRDLYFLLFAGSLREFPPSPNAHFTAR